MKQHNTKGLPVVRTMKLTAGVVAALAALCAPGASTDAFVPRHNIHSATGGGRPSFASTTTTQRTSTTSSIQEVATEPIPGMKPGTSGLRKKVEVWQGIDDDANKYYVENFIQSLLNTAIAKNDGQVPST